MRDLKGKRDRSKIQILQSLVPLHNGLNSKKNVQFREAALFASKVTAISRMYYRRSSHRAEKGEQEKTAL